MFSDLLSDIKSFREEETVGGEELIATVSLDETVNKKTKGSYSFGLGHQDEESLLEWFEKPELLRSKAKKIAKLIQQSKHAVVYTGAGISTAAKLPDYRGTDGMWTNKDRGTDQKGKYCATISDALPTFSHLAIAELVKRGLIKSVISTNVDGLHMRTGLKRLTNLAELHGNSYLEVCEKCNTQYLRDKDVLQYQTTDHRVVNRHWCGNYCEQSGCDGILLDTIVAFKEYLPADQLEFAAKESEKGDLALVLGSTMMVAPACDLPAEIASKPNGKMIICNLQCTPFDDVAEFLVHAYLDDLWYLIMRELNISVPNTIIRQVNGISTPLEINYSFETDEEMNEKYRTKYQQAIAKHKEILQEKKTSKGNALTRGENPYQRSTIKHRNNETLDIRFEKPELAFFHDCSSCNYTISSMSKKIVIENCNDMVFTLSGKIITNFVEIINCQNIRILIQTSVFTVTCDNSSSISLDYDCIDNIDMIAWAKVTDPKLHVDQKLIDLSIFDTIDPHKDQIISRKQEDGSISSTLTQRDQCGRLTIL